MADGIRIGLDEVVVHFSQLEDPRSEINRQHPLVSVVVIALMAVLAGASGPTAERCSAEGRLSPGVVGVEAGCVSRVLCQLVAVVAGFGGGRHGH